MSLDPQESIAGDLSGRLRSVLLLAEGGKVPPSPPQNSATDSPQIARTSSWPPSASLTDPERAP